MAGLRILMATAEYAPYAKAGGLADMVAGLARALASLGHDVRVVLPRYALATIPRAGMTQVGAAETSPVEIAGTHPPYTLHHLPSPANEPLVYFVDVPALYADGRVYGTAVTEAARFSLLCHGAARLCRELRWQPDVVHCHDWHTAPLVLLLRGPLAADPWFAESRSVLTIHNIGYQGTVAAASDTGLGLGAVRHLWPAEDLRRGDLNMLRAAVQWADGLTTVSPTHAAEILTDEYGKGLQELLRQRAGNLVGILNGIDETVWNPATDPTLPARFAAGDLDGRNVCRAALRRKAGLPNVPGLPLFGMITRLAEQKGVDLVLEALPPLLAAGRLQALVLGDGDPSYAAQLRDLAERMPAAFAFLEGHDEATAHLVFGGADAVMVPSRYEPCGLTQMYAMRYGAVPVVRETGGLKDTVTHFDPATGVGNGSVFKHADATGLRWAVGETLGWFEEPAVWNRIVENGMATDFSWSHQAPPYVDFYRRTIARPTPPDA